MLWSCLVGLLVVACLPLLLFAEDGMAEQDEELSGAGGCSQADPDEVEERTADLDVDQIPASVFRFYCAAAQAYQMDWAILAGVGREECRHGLSELRGCSPEGSVNDYGARGPMQFLGSTWRGSADRYDPDVAGPPVCVNGEDGRGDDQVCEATTGYATDGDGDGTADPWDWTDATYSSARMLVANGVEQDPRQAIYVYNHSDEYVDDVIHAADTYRDAIAPLVQTDTGTTPEREEVIRRADSWIGPDGQGVPYSQGAFHDGWRTDCSGFVSMAWNLRTANGDKLSTNTPGLRSTHAVPISRSELEPGDILLDATGGPNDRHVVLFERWDADSNYYWAYEQAGRVGTVHRRIRYPYDGAEGFTPYRLKVAG
jgi:cell wall-associated NlpC family hydrolase